MNTVLMELLELAGYLIKIVRDGGTITKEDLQNEIYRVQSRLSRLGVDVNDIQRKQLEELKKAIP